MDRRKFIKSLSAAGAASFVLPRFSIGKPGMSINSKVNLAFVGTGGRGANNIQALAALSNTNLVAFCDVDKRKFENIGMVKKGEPIDKSRYEGAKYFSDFREMIDTMGDKIDAVVVSTADHAHLPIAMWAMSKGKHLYCEKPLTNTIWGERQMLAASRKFGVVTQMGNQTHANEGLRLHKEWYEAGFIGNCTESHIWTKRPGWPQGMKAFEQTTQVPDYLNWDAWLAHSEFMDYRGGILPVKWRGFWQWGAGALGDMGCHGLDLELFVFDLGIPDKVEVIETIGATDIAGPTFSTIKYEFPANKKRGRFKLYWHEGFRDFDKRQNPNLPEFPKDWPKEEEFPNEGHLILGDEGYMTNINVAIGTPNLYPKSKYMDIRKNGKLPPKKYPRCVNGHHAQWIDGILKNDRTYPDCNFEYAAVLTEIVLLGNLALRSGSSIEWDMKTCSARGNAKANEFIKPQKMRDGWFTPLA